MKNDSCVSHKLFYAFDIAAGSGPAATGTITPREERLLLRLAATRWRRKNFAGIGNPLPTRQSRAPDYVGLLSHRAALDKSSVSPTKPGSLHWRCTQQTVIERLLCS